MAEMEALEEWIGGLLAKLQPGERVKLSLAIGRQLRRSNVKRIRANIEPDGGKMKDRKTKRKIKSKTGRIRRTGKMFPKISSARYLRVKASPDQVEVGYTNSMVSRVAAIHHYGKRGYVGKTPKGDIVKADYEARKLLGISDADREEILQAALDHLESGL